MDDLQQIDKYADKQLNPMDVVITDKGLELLQSLDYIDETSEQFFKSLSIKEINSLNDLLDKLREK
jgi:DNA-binding MarR family transcriptional regulator